MSDSLQPNGLQHTGLPCPSPTPGAYSNSCPLNRWCHPTISSSVVPFSFCLQSFPASGSFPRSQFIRWPKYWSFSFSWIFRTDFLSDLLVWCPRSPRDSHESSPIPEFQSINSSMLCFLYGPTLTSVHNYWKNHNFDYMDLCWKSNIWFLICCLGWS